MKRVFATLFTFILMSASMLFAQEYKMHTVAPKENYYSIGRLYNVAPKAIASYNNLNMEQGLQIGQKIKIPTGAQPSAPVPAATQPSSQVSVPSTNNGPVQHTVVQGETLYRISKIYNVDIAEIKQWNNMAGDDVRIGQVLVINKGGTRQQPEVKPAVPVATAPARQQETPVVETKKVPEDTALVYISPAPVESRKEDATEKAVSIRSTSSVQQTQVTKETPAPVVKEAQAVTAPPKPVSSVTTSAPEVKNISSSGVESNAPVEGSFSTAFVKGKNASNLSGDAATFKSTSGWQDRKYYVLINDVAPGTIVKIAAAEKVVYAKVLGNMPEMKENYGLLLRLSNAAASHLGIVDAKFPVQVTYYQ